MAMEQWIKYLKEKGVFENILNRSDIRAESSEEDDSSGSNSDSGSKLTATTTAEDAVKKTPTPSDEFTEEEKPEAKPKIKVFRPLITSPIIDFTTESHKYINAARRFYGVRESVNFSDEYKDYVSERQNRIRATNKARESDSTVALKGQKRRGAAAARAAIANDEEPEPQNSNPYAKAFRGALAKRRSLTKHDALENAANNLALESALDHDNESPEVLKSRIRKKKKSRGRFDRSSCLKQLPFHSIRKTKADEYLLESNSQHKFKCIPSLEDDDEWEDIGQDALQLEKKTEMDKDSQVANSKTDSATMTEGLAVMVDQDEAERIKQKASEIVERHAKNAVVRENVAKTMSQKQEQEFIPTRITTKTRFHPPGPKNELRSDDGTKNCHEPGEFDDLQSEFRNLKTKDGRTETEYPDLNLSFLKNGQNQIFYQEEVYDALREVESDSKATTATTDSESQPDEIPESVLDVLLEKTTEFYTEEELMEMRPGAMDLQAHLHTTVNGQEDTATTEMNNNLLAIPDTSSGSGSPRGHAPGYQIKYQEWSGKDPYSKHKVRKYKVVSADNMIQEFVRVTFPTMRRRRLKASSTFKDERFHSQPVPKYHTNFVKFATEYNRQAKSIVCEKLQIPGFQFDKIMEEISPAVGKSYHDVQVDSILENGPDIILPSSFPYSYCQQSFTLSLLRDSINLYEDLIERKETPRAKIGDMIHPATLNTAPEEYANLGLKSYHYPMPMGARFLDRPIDMIFTVAIYAPARIRGDIRFAKKEVRDDTNIILRSKVEVLGSQSLADIRDMFLCLSDCYDTQETHQLPEKLTRVEPSRLTKTVSPRYLFLVEDKILVDYADSESCSTMKRVKLWYEEKHGKELECNDSNKTKISDLKISFGQPYLFIHQENCQHIFQFEGGRVCRPNETDAPNSFPRFSFKRDVHIKCPVDQKRPVRWRIIGFDVMPEDPMLLCTQCVQKFCFDKDGNKRGAFKMYQFDPTV